MCYNEYMEEKVNRRQIVTLSKLKGFADEKLNVSQSMFFLL